VCSQVTSQEKDATVQALYVEGGGEKKVIKILGRQKRGKQEVEKRKGKILMRSRVGIPPASKKEMARREGRAARGRKRGKGEKKNGEEGATGASVP